MRRVILLTALAGLLTACSQDDPVLFDGQAFRTKAAKVKENPRQFTVEVSPVSASTEGALAAGEYEGIKYCVTQFGTSYIDWSVGPETDPAEIPLDRDRWSFAGTCRP